MGHDLMKVHLAGDFSLGVLAGDQVDVHLQEASWEVEARELQEGELWVWEDVEGALQGEVLWVWVVVVGAGQVEVLLEGGPGGQGKV